MQKRRPIVSKTDLRKLPTEIVGALNKEVIAVLAEPALQARLADLGIA